MTDPSRHGDLDGELVELGRHLDTGTPPDVTAAVRARLTSERPRRHWYAARGWRWAVAAALVAALLLAGTPPGRAAVARVLRFAGVEFHQGRGPAHLGTGALPREESVTLEDARRRVGFRLLLPAGLGRPKQVLVSDQNRVVSIIYSGQIRVDEFDGSLHQAYFKKFVAAGAASPTAVDGRAAYWLGEPHTLVYVGRDGSEHEGWSRVSGPALVWQYGRVALRLEGVADRERARGLAATLAPR
jgi:hypothetical protein